MLDLFRSLKSSLSPLGLALTLTLPSVTRLLAQDGSLDGSFQSPLFPAPLPLIAVEANGKVLYASVPDNIHYLLGRLTSSGAAESSINIGDGPESITAPIDAGSFHLPGSTNPATINVLRPLANGQILVGGTFSHFNKVARKLLVRLNADGSVDPSFNPANSFEGDNISNIVIGPGEKIYAGGQFKKFNGSSRNVGLVRLNADGTLDSSFVDGTISYGANVTGLSLQPDGKVVVDAAYANAAFQATYQVYRLGANGGLDSGFAQGAGTPVVPARLRHGLMANGQVLVAGGSGLYNGVTVNSALFRLNADGTVDTSYPGLTLGLSNVGGLIGRFLPTPDGRIYFSGAFDVVAGQTLHGLARLNADGTLDPSFAPAVYVSPSPGALALQPDGKLLVCNVVIVGTEAKYVISRLNGSGGGSPPAPQIGSMTMLPGGVIQLKVSGSASKVVVQTSSNLAAWNTLSTNSIVNGLVSFTDSLIGSSSAKFYKLLVAP